MAVDMFLRVDSIEGESQAQGHKGEIQLLGWSWAVTQTGTSGTGGGSGTGKAEHHDIEIRKVADRASPVLYQMCVTGKHIESADLTVRKAGGDALEYLVIHLENIIVTAFELGGEPKDDQVTEKIRINFSRIAMHYTPQVDGGGGGAKVSGGWDLKLGAPFQHG